MLKLAIGLPAYGGTVASLQTRMWMQLGAAILKRRTEGVLDLVANAIEDVCGIDFARNRLLDIAKASGADWLLMIDSDTWIERAGEILDSILYGEEKGAAIVGVPVPLKDGENLNVYMYNDENKLRVFPVRTSDRMYQVDGIGGAVMAIAVKRIGNARFAFTKGTGEDLGFCHEINEQKKGRIWIDPRIKSRHKDRPNVLAYDADIVETKQGEIGL